LGDNFVGRSDDGVHGITVSIVKRMIAVVVVTLGRISGGHVKKFDRFFSVFGKKGKNSVPTDGATVQIRLKSISPRDCPLLS
jgi:hypothetical protein